MRAERLMLADTNALITAEEFLTIDEKLWFILHNKFCIHYPFTLTGYWPRVQRSEQMHHQLLFFGACCFPFEIPVGVSAAGEAFPLWSSKPWTGSAYDRVAGNLGKRCKHRLTHDSVRNAMFRKCFSFVIPAWPYSFIFYHQFLTVYVGCNNGK